MLIALLLLPIVPAAIDGTNGQRYDSGATMTERSTGAPEALDALRFVLGTFDVVHVVSEGDTETEIRASPRSRT